MSHTLHDWQKLFLKALSEVPVVQHACDAAGVQRCTAYRARQADEAFAQAWDDAMEAGVDRAEKEAFRRAVIGFEEPVIYQGALQHTIARDATGAPILDPVSGEPRAVPLTVRKHSDVLLSLVLKGRRKKVYAERTELTGADGKDLDPRLDEVTRAARLSAIVAAAKARKEAADLGINPEDLA